MIINGREKVLVAQERMATNHVLCIKMKNSPWKAEVRSKVEMTNRAIASCMVIYDKPKKGVTILEKILITWNFVHCGPTCTKVLEQNVLFVRNAVVGLLFALLSFSSTTC